MYIVKDKAKIIFQVETLTKFQEDLQEQIQVLHSQLEQERSKSHAAINEQRRLMEVINDLKYFKIRHLIPDPFNLNFNFNKNYHIYSNLVVGPILK